MVVFVLQSVPPGLRGELSRWMLEPRAGVFVGRPSAMVRDRLWKLIQDRAGSGGGILIHTADTEQGFRMEACGDTDRSIRDFEGLLLIQTP